MRRNIKIAVLGGGTWGAVLAQHLSGNKKTEVYIWEFFQDAALRLAKTRRHPLIPGFRLNSQISVTSNLESAARNADVLLFVLPSPTVRQVAKRLAALFPGQKFLTASASKGLEPKTLLTPCEVIESELDGSQAYALSGPSFAREVAHGVWTRLVLAGKAGAQADFLEKLFCGGNISLEKNADRRGVELCGSLKNVFAIGCGILDGLESGDNAKAAIMTEALREMADIAERSGGLRETVYGPAGLGDFIATGTSEQSRNRAYGEKLGKGESPGQAERGIGTVVEGVKSLEAAKRLAARARAKTPILDAVWSASRGRPPIGFLGHVVRSQGSGE